MSMKTVKKILAGTLALMSTFTAVSAEPVKSEKVTAVSENVKTEETKSKHKIVEKVLNVGILGAATIATVGGTVVLAKNILKIREEYKERIQNVRLNVSRQIFLYYLIPEAKNFINNLKKTKQKESVKHLLDVLENERTMSRRDFMRKLDRASGLPEISEDKPWIIEEGVALNRCTIPKLTLVFLIANASNYPTDTVIIDVKSCINDLKHLENVMEIRLDKTVYDLTSVVMCDEEDYCFTTAYVKHKDGKWHRHSFEGFKETIDDDALRDKLSTTKQKVSLVYTKRS